LVNQLGAWETDLALQFEFFPNGDTSQDPQVSDAGDKRWILNEVGLCLMSLGRLSEAAPFYERVKDANLSASDWRNASNSYRNLAELYAHLGELAQSAQAAQQALDLVRRAENKDDECYSLAYQARAAHLLGDVAAAGAAFAQAEALEREIDPNKRYLYSLRGIQHVDHLRRTGQTDYARRVTEANLKICVENRFIKSVSQCHRVLGDLDAQTSEVSQTSEVYEHYDEALKIARSISLQFVLMEALLARGRFFARQATLAKVPQSSQGFDDLNEALGYALAGGYRIYEADIRIALAWAHLAMANSPRPEGEGSGERARELEAARAEAERALQMSEEMGYYWGKVDAAEVLSAIVQ
jgi:tetratricopeptide (TPR) repeat protein